MARTIGILNLPLLVVAFLTGAIFVYSCGGSGGNSATGQDTVESRLAALGTAIGLVTVTQVQSVNSFSLTPTNFSGEVQWDITEIAAVSNGAALLNIVDDGGNTRTQFVATVPCRVVTLISSDEPPNLSNQVLVNGLEVGRGSTDTAGSNSVGGASISLSTGDILTFSTAGSTFYEFGWIAMAEAALSTL